MADNRMAPPKADFYTGGPEDRPRMATQLQRAQAEREQPADHYLYQTELVGLGYDAAGKAHFDAVLNQRDADGWEYVESAPWGEERARLIFRRAR